MSNQQASIKAIISAAIGPGIAFDDEGNLFHMNDGAERLFEFSMKAGSEAVSFTSMLTIESPEEEGHFISDWKKIKEIGQNQEGSIALCTKRSGDKFDAEVRMSVVDSMLAVFLKPIETDGGDHMSRYMSTLLNMLMSIIESSLDPIFQINQEGTIQMANPAAEKTFGYSRDDFVGNNISMICGGGHAPKHAGYLAAYLQTGVTKVMGKKRELPARRKDGSEFPIELGLVEIIDDTSMERMFVGFVRDLSDIKAKERMAMGLVEACMDPLFRINEKGTIQFVNDAAVQEFGYTREELLESNISTIVSKDHADKHDSYIQNYIKTGVAKVMGKQRELSARRKDGSEFPIELGISEIEVSTGEERMFCGFVRKLEK